MGKGFEETSQYKILTLNCSTKCVRFRRLPFGPSLPSPAAKAHICLSLSQAILPIGLKAGQPVQGGQSRGTRQNESGTQGEPLNSPHRISAGCQKDSMRRHTGLPQKFYYLSGGSPPTVT